jgi:ornithine carbamoyltransferase
MGQRTELLKEGDKAGLKSLEQEALANNAKYTDWECNEEKMAATKDGKALYMHCLPADISDVSCEKGEVSKSVFDRYRKDTYIEASYKPFVVASMMFLGRLNNPIEKLSGLVNNNKKRF